MNRDGRFDVISLFDEGELTREEMDSDYDGAFDWTDHYHQIPGDNDLRDPEAQGRGRRRRGFGSR